LPNKRSIIIALILASLSTAAGTVYIIDSNTAHVKWSLACGGAGPICVLFQGLAGNATYATYTVSILNTGTQTLSNQFINTTVYSGPAHVVYNLNGTSGTSWLFGPYSFSPSLRYNYDFQLKYNGTFGSYDFAVNVLQAQ
jgi:hypothetical protein